MSTTTTHPDLIPVTIPRAAAIELVYLARQEVARLDRLDRANGGTRITADARATTRTNLWAGIRALAQHVNA